VTDHAAVNSSPRVAHVATAARAGNVARAMRRPGLPALASAGIGVGIIRALIAPRSDRVPRQH